ncbi:MAG TPA: TetR family transcriptional regulator C-terminal domain-containing protein [Acidimicrobiia bacterium]|nr:TetR family transcriptional regulator C-terminal domain-containing protein [Acidimicrobiia bacterium]
MSVRMAPGERRDAIVAAALAIARRKGLAATTVRDVASEMGTSSGLIHHYFDSMDDVLAAAFDRAASDDLARTTEAMAEDTDPVGKLVAFFDNYSVAGSDWTFQLWLDAWAEAGRRPAVGATSERLNIAWQQLLAGTLKEGVAAGVFDCPDPDATAWRIISLLDGLSLQVVAHQATLARETVSSWIRSFAESEAGLAAGTLR